MVWPLVSEHPAARSAESKCNLKKVDCLRPGWASVPVPVISQGNSVVPQFDLLHSYVHGEKLARFFIQIDKAHYKAIMRMAPSNHPRQCLRVLGNGDDDTK
jgi:hypothetical protein